MAETKTLSELLDDIMDVILTGGRRTRADKMRELTSNMSASSLNVKDGGLLVEKETGYKTEITPSDPKSFATKKFVLDNSGGSTYNEIIQGDGDGGNDTRTITHGKNNYTPSIALWYEYDTGKWRMLDNTQGITTDESTPDELTINLLAYEGNTTENKYRIIVR